MSRKENLPRGIHRRGPSLVISFAYEGKVKYLSLGDCSAAFARDQRALIRSEIRKGTWQPKPPARAPQPAPDPIVRVADLWPPYLCRYRNEGGKDEQRQQISWNHLKPTFEKMRVEEVSTDSVNRYIEARKADGVQGGTINREVTVLQAMFRQGAQYTIANGKRMVDRLPAFPRKLKEGQPRRGFLKDDQFALLAANATEPWLRCFIECAYKFGFRKGELLGLRKRQVDLIDGLILLEDTKAGDPRAVPVNETMRQLFVELVRGKKDDDYVFTRPDGSVVVDFRDDWYALCVAAKLGVYVPAKRKNGESYQRYIGLTPHDFRRSAIRNMVRRGVGEKVAMTISGHSTRSVFDRYNLVDKADLVEAARKIEGQHSLIPAEETHTKVTQANVRVS